MRPARTAPRDPPARTAPRVPRPRGANGTNGTNGAPGTAQAWAEVNKTGVAVNGNGAMQVGYISAGTYCVALKKTWPASRPAGVVATPDFNGNNSNGSTIFNHIEVATGESCTSNGYSG